MQAEQGDELIFILGQIGVDAVHEHAVLAVVDGQCACGEDAGIGHGRAAVGRPGVADGRADTREQLFGAKGLRQVIVRARVQRGNLIALVAARGDDDDGNL